MVDFGCDMLPVTLIFIQTKHNAASVDFTMDVIYFMVILHPWQNSGGFWHKTAWSITCLDSRETPRRDPSQSQKVKGFGGDT